MAAACAWFRKMPSSRQSTVSGRITGHMTGAAAHDPAIGPSYMITLCPEKHLTRCSGRRPLQKRDWWLRVVVDPRAQITVQGAPHGIKLENR